MSKFSGWTGDEITIYRHARNRWLLVGLMIGITFMHAVQPIASLTGSFPWNGKLYIAAAGAVLYAACAVLIAKSWADADRAWPRLLGLWIAVCGPIAGVLGVSAGAALVAAGVLPGPFRAFDAFQICGGVLQLAALALAVVLLRRPRR